MTDTLTNAAAPAQAAPPYVPPPPRRGRWTDDARRRMRIILMLVLAPFTIVGLLLATKLISVNAFADAAQLAFERRAYQESEVQARLAAAGLPWDPTITLEPWKGFYNAGVALGMQGGPEQLVEARGELETALTLQGEEGSNEHCIILVSIVYVVEKQGDQAREAADTQTANGLYQEALGIIDAAPEGCFAEPTTIQADTGEQLEQAVPRIEEKIEDESGGGGDSEEESEGGEGEESEDPSEGQSDEPQTQEEQLEEQNQQAQEQQQQQDEYNQQQGEEQGGGGVDQPW